VLLDQYETSLIGHRNSSLYSTHNETHVVSNVCDNDMVSWCKNVL